MADISASLVKELRETTGLGMMDCKRALVESKGDLNLAIENLRKSSGLKARKKAGRKAADGLIAVFSENIRKCMVEINCETDFVAKDELFLQYSKEVIAKLSSNINLELKELMKGELEKKRDNLIQHLGENIVVRRIAKSKESADFVGLYLHSNKKIACIASMEGGDEVTANNIAMHIVATDPISICKEDLPEDTLDKEKSIFESQLTENNKPREINLNIVEGKIKKYLSEVCLTEQYFVKEPELKIKDMLDKHKAKVIEFKRFEVGEGIELEKKDFADEVKSQIKKS